MTTRLSAARSRLIIRPVTKGTIAEPHRDVRTVDGIVYQDWCEVEPEEGREAWPAVGLGWAEDVAEYRMARAAVQAAAK